MIQESFHCNTAILLKYRDTAQPYVHTYVCMYTYVAMYVVLELIRIYCTYVRYSPVTTSHTRDLSRVVPCVIQREEKICHA